MKEGLDAEVQVADPAAMLSLTGPSNAHLRVLEAELGVQIGQRGDTLRIAGSIEAVAATQRVIGELLELVHAGRTLSELEVKRATQTLSAHPDLRLRELYNDVALVTARRKAIAPKGVAQQQYIQAIRDHDVVFGVGPAGTGKTYLAMAMAIRALQEKRVQRIVLTRPAVEAGEKLGFLPGDLAEKVNPYLRPLYDALHDMMEVEKAEALVEKGIIEVAPLAFMRGRTLNECFVIHDEAQNSTTEQMKMFLTRLGFESKAVITGDVSQVDLPGGRKSGLVDAVELLSHVEGIRICHFTAVDVVRHPLVQRIVRAYDERDARHARGQR